MAAAVAGLESARPGSRAGHGTRVVKSAARVVPPQTPSPLPAAAAECASGGQSHCTGRHAHNCCCHLAQSYCTKRSLRLGECGGAWMGAVACSISPPDTRHNKSKNERVPRCLLANVGKCRGDRVPKSLGRCLICLLGDGVHGSRVAQSTCQRHHMSEKRSTRHRWHVCCCLARKAKQQGVVGVGAWWSVMCAVAPHVPRAWSAPQPREHTAGMRTTALLGTVPPA